MMGQPAHVRPFGALVDGQTDDERGVGLLLHDDLLRRDAGPSTLHPGARPFYWTPSGYRVSICYVVVTWDSVLELYSMI